LIVKPDLSERSETEHLLEVCNLSVDYLTAKGTVKAVRDVSFTLDKGKTLGIVGESGCGKSTLGFSIIRCVPPPGVIRGGSILFEGIDILKLSEEDIRQIRGRYISMIMQDPMTSLNPVMRVGEHITEMIAAHDPSLAKEERKKRAILLMEKLGILKERFEDYPHQFSGGMRQRVMIGLALALNPKLVIADEPTTSLDALVEAQILTLLNNLRSQLGLTMMLITHNIGIVAETCDKVIIMYAGEVVEESPTLDLFEKPLHPYTQGLLRAVPNIRLDQQDLYWIPGSPPDLINPPEGCSFQQRCPYAFAKCKKQPPLTTTSAGRKVRCFLYH